MCHIKVEEDNFSFEINSWDDFTVSLLGLYAESKKNNGNDSKSNGQMAGSNSFKCLPDNVCVFIREQAGKGLSNDEIHGLVLDRFGFDVHVSTISRHADRKRQGISGNGKKKPGRRLK